MRNNYPSQQSEWWSNPAVVNMIAEEHYREFVMPYDRKLSDHYANFGVHNCGWKVDAYARAYSEIRKLGYLDFGADKSSQGDRFRILWNATGVLRDA